MRLRLVVHVLMAAALVATSACRWRSSPTEPADVRVATLRVGQSVTISGGTVLSFRRVVSDSRCPAEVACVWEGEITLALTLSEVFRDTPFTLSDHATRRTVDGRSFTLLSVEPRARVSAIPEGEYRATILVE